MIHDFKENGEWDRKHSHTQFWRYHWPVIKS